MKTIAQRAAEVDAKILGAAPHAAPPLPWWALPIMLLKAPEDRGIGDTIARRIGPIGGEAYKTWFQNTFKRSCGCQERQEDLNRQYPYEPKG